jgi:class 3 adenylate cyclase
MIKQKFDALLGFPVIGRNPADLEKIKTAVLASKDWELFRINPLRFAAATGVSEKFAVEFFVHASKIGLFDFQWNIICPGCAGIEYSHASIGEIARRSYHCIICNVAVSSDLDDQVEVAFTVNQSVRKLAVNPFESFESYRRFFFSDNYQRSPELTNYSHDNFRGFSLVSPDASHRFELEVKSGEMYRLLSMVSHSMAVITVDENAPDDSRLLEVDLASDGFLNRDLRVRPGQITIAVRNRSKSMNAATVLKTDYGLLKQIMQNHPNIRKPFFTAKMLINNQSFKDLFRVHHLPEDFNLNVRSVAFLFTDLKGSTKLYEQSGDIRAFHVVQEHFKILTEVVRAHSGAIVKTMGDALMASFSDPADAVKAGLGMLKATSGFWQQHGVPDMGLKIGIHEGPALAVNADDRLDYFGQTVNTAARLQDQARAGEIVLSRQVSDLPEISSILQQHELRLTQQSVLLRGIEHPVPVSRIHW